MKISNAILVYSALVCGFLLSPTPRAYAAATPTWTIVCDGSGNGLSGPGPNCTPTATTVPQARGYNTRLPYDSVNHQFLYYAGDVSVSGIYSYHLWEYSTSTHSFTSIISNGSAGDGDCPWDALNQTTTAGASFNPLQAHPEGNNAFDSGHAEWVFVPGVCDQFYSAVTDTWNASSKTMNAAINQWPNSPTCNGNFNCSIASDQGMEYISGYGKTIWCCYNNGAGINMAEFDGANWTNIATSVKGSNGALCVNDMSGCPPMPRTAFGMLTDGTYLYLYGGCICTSPADSSSNVAGGTIDNNLWRYDPVAKQWTELSPAGGTKPPAVNDFPFIAYDSARSRFILYAENSDKSAGLWQYSIAGNTWSQVSFFGTGFDFTTTVNNSSVTMDGGVDGDMANYDPATDIMAVIFFRNQANSPAVYELSFGGSGNNGIVTSHNWFPASNTRWVAASTSVWAQASGLMWGAGSWN